MHGTPDNHPKGGSIFSADRRGIAAGGVTRSGPFLSTGEMETALRTI